MQQGSEHSLLPLGRWGAEVRVAWLLGWSLRHFSNHLASQAELLKRTCAKRGASAGPAAQSRNYPLVLEADRQEHVESEKPLTLMA